MSAAVLVAGIVCATVVAIVLVGSITAVAVTRRRLEELDLESLPPEVRSLRIDGLRTQRARLEASIPMSLAPSVQRKQIARIDAELAILYTSRTAGAPPVQKGK